MQELMLLRRFASARPDTKRLLFYSCCTPIYGCQLWSHYRLRTFDKIRVAYNDALRLLLKVPRWTSASQLFADCRLPAFNALVRKHTFSLLTSMRRSDNSLLVNYVSSDLFLRSRCKNGELIFDLQVDNINYVVY